MRSCAPLLAAAFAAIPLSAQAPAPEKTGASPNNQIHLRMEESVRKQRESVRRQAGFSTEDSSWFTVPWQAVQFVEPTPPPAPAAETSPQVKPAAWIFGHRPECEALSAAGVAPIVTDAARSEGLHPDLLHAVIQHESGYQPCAVSPKGALGLMQLMPETARGLGVSDPFDPWQNIGAGARFLGGLLQRFDGDLGLALSAYNAGPGNVERHGGMPPFGETRRYVGAILQDLKVR